MSTQPQTNTTGGQKPARRKNQNPGFGAAKVSRADQGTFQEGVFTLPETSAPSTSAPSRNNNGTRRHNKPMSKSLESSSLLPSTTNHGASPSISSKAGRSAKSSSGKHLSFAPDAALVQIHHFPPTSPISYPPSSSHAEDSAASSAASKPSHWAGGAYANSPDPTSIPLPTFGPKPAAGMSVMPVATAPTPANFSAQASLDLRRLLNIPAPPLSIPLNATA